MGYDAKLAEFDELGANLAALSVDHPVPTAKLRDERSIRFPLLCDRDRSIIRDWGLFDDSKPKGIPFPSAWVLGPDRTVLLRSLDRKATRVRSRPMLDFLRTGDAPPRRDLIIPDPVTTARLAARRRRKNEPS